MNLIIEVIDGVAYAVEEVDGVACPDCILAKTERCQYSQVCEITEQHQYRRLTAKEREELIKAIGRGIE